MKLLFPINDNPEYQIEFVSLILGSLKYSEKGFEEV